MKQEKIPPRPKAKRKPRAADPFTPVDTRARHDGWTPDRQFDFIEALAECACVTEAAGSVAMSAASAYKLRARPDAQAFRLAWDAAIDFAMARLVDAALGRAVHGVAVPIFYKGEQVGERREFPENLAMFLMAAHAPKRFGARRQTDPLPLMHFDAAGLQLGKLLALLDEQARGATPYDFPTLAQQRRAATFLGFDLESFIGPGSGDLPRNDAEDIAPSD